MEPQTLTDDEFVQREILSGADMALFIWETLKQQSPQYKEAFLGTLENFKILDEARNNAD